MARGSVAKTSFNAGEFSPLMEGRTDIARYASAVKHLENFLPTVPGPIRRRPGTRFVYDGGADAPVLVPFIFNREQSYVISIGADGINVYTDRGIIEISPGVPLATVINSPWTAAPRRADGSVRISWTQSGDQLYICDPEGNLPIQVISRASDLLWVILPWSPYQPPITDVEPTKGISIWFDAVTKEFYAYDEGQSQFKTAGEVGVLAWVDSFVENSLITRTYTPGMTSPSFAILVVQGRWYFSRTAGTMDSNTPIHTFGVKSHGPSVELEYLGNGTFYFDIIETGVTGVTGKARISRISMKPVYTRPAASS